jgi:L-iditol 2-dehydrogenase
MKAAVYQGPGRIELCERPDPEPRPDNLIADVICCAICGSDLKLAVRGNPRFSTGRIIGHELVGTLCHVGNDIDGFEPGERITLATTVGCGDCAYCRLGLSNLCEDAVRIGSDSDGAFAPQVPIPGIAAQYGNVVKVPEEVPAEQAALSEPLSCAINAQKLAGLQSGQRVVIIGGGPLGVLHAQVALATGASRVMVTQRSEPRLSMLRQMDGIMAIDGGNEDVAQSVRSETDGLGADVVIVCGPTPEAHRQALDLTRKGGTVSLFASLPPDEALVDFNSRDIHYGERRIVGSSDSRPEHVRKAVRLLAEGRLDVEPVITHRLPLEKMQHGLELMKKKESLKVLLEP